MGAATSNFLAGNASLSSSDGTLAISGGPAFGQIDFTAGPNAGGKTLAALYAFGLANGAVADNVFAMPDGNRRWADGNSIVSSLATVSDAFWETPNAVSDRRVGAWLARRWVSAGEAEAAFNTEILFDSSYVGNPIERSWIVDVAYLTNNGSEAGVTGDAYVTRKYSLHNFLGGQPFGFPSPGLVTGAYSAEQTFLFNGGGLGNNKTARIVSGWGQEALYAQPQRAGVTPGVVAVYDPGTTADAVGNGTGFWCGWGTATSFTSEQFTGGLGLTMLALDVNGAYRAGLWARADHTTVNEVATFDNTAGARILTGGLQLADTSGAPPPVSDANAMRMYWNKPFGVLQVSNNGSPYGGGSGGATIAMVTATPNAGGAVTFPPTTGGFGVSGPPVRWAVIPDGVGGIFLMPSWF